MQGQERAGGAQKTMWGLTRVCVGGVYSTCPGVQNGNPG